MDFVNLLAAAFQFFAGLAALAYVVLDRRHGSLTARHIGSSRRPLRGLIGWRPQHAPEPSAFRSRQSRGA